MMCRKDFEDKVRECGAAYGMEIYSDMELISLAIGVSPEKLTGSMQEILEHPGNVSGIGKKKELAVFAVRELAKRLMKGDVRKADIVHGPEDAAHFARAHFVQESKEHFAVMMLNTKNHIIGLKDVSIGSLTASIVHPREGFETAILHHSAAIILVHNHPSGDPSPSREDIAVTHRLVKAGKLMDISVIDHIITGGNSFVSMKEKNLLE